MNILNKYTLKSLMLNRKRTLVTIIGIILSTAMICTTLGFVVVFQRSMINSMIKYTGDYYVEFSQVDKLGKDTIINDEDVKCAMLSKDIGYAKLENVKNQYKQYLFLNEYDQTALENYNINLVEGRLPKNSKEVIICNSFKEDYSGEYNIGDKIKLDIGKRIYDSQELWQDNPIEFKYSEKEYMEICETLENKCQREFEIVGITEDILREPSDAPGYTIISKMEDSNDKVDILVKTKSAKDIYNFVNRINKTNNDNGKEKYTTEYNKELLMIMGVSENDSINSMLYGVGSAVIGIIMVTSIFVIRNSFSISVVERLKQYGVLSSIGATPKQIKRNILFEGFILGIISIPIGILSGMLVVYILVAILQNLLAPFLNGLEFVYSVSILSLILSTVLGFVTILLSALVPGIRVSRTSPIDAIRSSNDIKIKGKKLRTSKLFDKIFGIEGQIAFKNLKRSRKKYRTTVVSIFVSIVVFISLNTFLDYGIKMSNIYYQNLNFNVNISFNRHNMSRLELNKKMLNYYNEILKLENIQDYSIIKNMEFTVDKKQLSHDAIEVFNVQKEGNVQLIAVGKHEYNRYLKKLGLDPKLCKTKGILIDNIGCTYESKYKEFNYLDVEKNSKLILKTNSDSQSSIALEIVKRTTECPTGLVLPKNSAFVIVSDEYIENYDYSVISLSISTTNSYKLIEDIEKIDKKMYNELLIDNYDKFVKQNNSLILVISIFLYGFITVISLIGITNIFNTITTNMSLRSKEFAILKSIGMTDKEFNRMINLESFMYGFKSLLYGIPVGIGLSYLIYIKIIDFYQTPYMLPIKAILICTAFVFITIFATMGYSRKKINKQNIIDTIRNENI